ncbi:MAG: 4-(cytidine 5'-diphospho)-2-C-methyl-D-erythritol kinase [Gemmataceae bacterium]|nr:4-(cytidine 5'-diphospho)-2-C-methyl-D-erythritol kinase [Gemmataceae bacterium]
MPATSSAPRTGSPHPTLPAGRAGLVVAAPAKLNLFLEVRGKRPDGYHDLETLMVGVDLYDTLELQPAPGGTLALTCDPPGLSAGPDNLVWKAADRLRTAAGRPDLGASIRLTKRIPTQAGLAGGSSDAAATLVGLNRVWGLDLPKAELAAVAADVGSDVAFFLDLPAAWCTGRGEIVSPERPGAAFHFVLVCPPVGLATADVFRRLTPPTSPASGDAARAAFRAGDPEALGAALFNRLEAPAFGLAPLVEAVYWRLAGLNPAGCRMSGSGSAVFAVARSAADAARLAAAFRAATPPGEPESRVLLVRSRHLVPG